VEAVREVEEERQRDDQHDDEGEIHRRLSLDRWW